jgi:hypothetical protein
VTNSAPPASAALPPIALHRLDLPATAELVDLLATFEDLQTVLRCCERLMVELKAEERDETAIEAVWTLALLSYARGFTERPSGAQLTEADLTAVQPHGDVLEWHRMLLLLHKHHAHQLANPRERFTIGVACDEAGAATGIGVTSVRQPLVDTVTVRQTGAIAFSLGRLIDDRITCAQELIFNDVKTMPPAQLQRLPNLDL